MNGSELHEYKQLVQENTTAILKMVAGYEEAIKRLDDERQKHENFNTSGIMRYAKLFAAAITVVVTILIIAIVAFVFVSTGHPINLKAGDSQIQSK